jgi:hypothetical protein
MAATAENLGPLVQIQLSHLLPEDGEAGAEYEAAANLSKQGLLLDKICVLQFDNAEAAVLRGSLGYASAMFERQWSQQNTDSMRQSNTDNDKDGGFISLPEKGLYNVILGERCAQSCCFLSLLGRLNSPR